MVTTRNLTPAARDLTRSVWLAYYDSSFETTMGDVALELDLPRSSVRKAVQSLVQVDLMRAHPERVGLYEHDHYDDPTTAFEEFFPMDTTTATPSLTAVDVPMDDSCRCGCGEAVQGKRSEYRPGHDARHVGQVGRVLAALPDFATTEERHAVLAALPTEALRMKALRMEDGLRTKTARRSNRQPRKTPTLRVTEGTVKVGRWTYPARAYSDGRVERNSKRDGSGEWLTHDGEMD